jgi:hypothetical protein
VDECIQTRALAEKDALRAEVRRLKAEVARLQAVIGGMAEKGGEMPGVLPQWRLDMLRAEFEKRQRDGGAT